MLSNVDELLDKVRILMGTSYDKVSDDGLYAAAEQALTELNWTLPETDNGKCFWIIERTKRFVISILLTESAHKFKYKQINLDQRFTHYFKLIELMDKQFVKSVSEDTTIFDIGTLGFIAEYIDSGFTYNAVGESA